MNLFLIAAKTFIYPGHQEHTGILYTLFTPFPCSLFVLSPGNKDGHLKIQQGEVQSPVPGEEQFQAPIHARGHPAGQHFCRKGPRSTSGYQVEHKSAMCPCSKQG